MATKTFKAAMTAEGDEGHVMAAFSVFNIRDEGNDVVLPSFFTDGQEVAMAAWGHDWWSLPPGKGVIKVQDDRATFDGHFFMDTQQGAEHYRTVKAMGGLQEWSFGFDILESKTGDFDDDDDDRQARYLVRGETFEVSPVLIGMNRETYTEAIKSHRQSYNDQGDAALTAVASWIERTESLVVLRAKDGRGLSDDHKGKLAEFYEQLGYLSEAVKALTAEAEPVVDVSGLFVEYQRTRAALAGAIGA